MRARSDTFLGWTRTNGADNVERVFYVRQLRDWKWSAPIEQMVPTAMTVCARRCGWDLRPGTTPAPVTARAGRPSRRDGQFDQAIADFAETYADQNERGCAALQAAVKDGKVESTTEI